MENIVSGIILPCGSGVEPEPIFVDGLETLQRVVEGHIDVVTTTMGHDDVVIVGYVNDEFLMLDLEYNYLATALFGREIYGNVVVVWGLNEDGVYDGENHDLPSNVVGFINEDLVAVTASAYGKSALMSIFCDIAIDSNLALESDVDFHAEQLALATTRAEAFDEENDVHIDFFIALIHNVMDLIKAEHMEIAPEAIQWAEVILMELESKKG